MRSCNATRYGAVPGAANWAHWLPSSPDTDENARVALAEHFRDWERLLADAFERMRDNGELCDDIDAPTMATSVMAAVQGGYLLAQTAHDSTPMKMALDMAIGHVRSYQQPR